MLPNRLVDCFMLVGVAHASISPDLSSFNRVELELALLEGMSVVTGDVTGVIKVFLRFHVYWARRFDINACYVIQKL